MKLSTLCINTELYQMKIVLATATEMEMNHFRNTFKESNMVELEYCITGVGLIATTFHLQKTILGVKPDLIIQVGLAGSFSTACTIGDAVAVKNEIIADMGVFERDGYKDKYTNTRRAEATTDEYLVKIQTRDKRLQGTKQDTSYPKNSYQQHSRM
jgi:nucleoside phosphorylase